MAGRPVDHQRRAELLDAVVDYTVEHGFSEVSWRPVAAAVGVSPTTLVHHFGTKEQMLVAILGCLRERIAAASDRAGEQPDLATAARAAWTRTSDPRQEAEFRLFFAVYGRALQAPQQFAGFLERVVADWMSMLIQSATTRSRNRRGGGGAHRHTGDRDDPRPAARPARHRRTGPGPGRGGKLPRQPRAPGSATGVTQPAELIAYGT
jgi:AcrR family transcriptional regulator